MRHDNFKKILCIEESIFFQPELFQEKFTFLGYNLFRLNPPILEEFLNILRYSPIVRVIRRVFDVEHYTVRKILENLTKKATNEHDFHGISRCKMVRHVLDGDAEGLFS